MKIQVLEVVLSHLKLKTLNSKLYVSLSTPDDKDFHDSSQIAFLTSGSE